MPYKRLIINPLSKSLRRQKEQRFTRVASNFFKDGATIHGRERLDRAMKSMYGHSFVSMKHSAPTKQVIKYNKKIRSHKKIVRQAIDKRKNKATSGWMTYKKGDIIPF
jgi:hypothetical protein